MGGYVCPPSRRIVAFGPSIGTYQGRDIPEWIESGDGRRHDYAGVSGRYVDLEKLKSGESVIAPGLIYQERSAGPMTF